MKIKLTFLIALVCLLTISKGHTQESDSPIGYGVKLGATMNSFVEHFNKKYSSYGSGVVAGGFVTYRVIDILTVSADILYAQKSARNFDPSILYNTDGPLFSGARISSTESNMMLHALEGQITANVYLPVGEGFHPKLMVGGVFSTNINATATNKRLYELDDFKEVAISKDNITDRFMRHDYALVFGAGVDVDVDPYAILIEFKYKPGLTSVNNVEHFPYFTNNIFELTLGFKL